MNHQSAAVIDLDAYRQQRTPERKIKTELQEDPQRVAAELAYHLLKAIQTVRKLPH
jgi:hypothetical protein